MKCLAERLKKDLFFCILNLLIIVSYITSHGQNINNGWTEVTPIANDNGDIFDLTFFNKDSGWVCGWTRYEQGWRQIVAFTNNAGSSWDTTKFTYISVLGKVISFFNFESGLTGDGIILNTYDAGKTWTRYDSVFHFFFTNIECISQKYAYCCGGRGKIIRTTDQGLSWKHIESDIFKNTRYGGLSVIDSITVYTNCDDQLLRTTDGGISWIEINMPNELPHYEDIKFIDIDYGWIIGGVRSIFRTPNGGESWEDQSPANYYDSFVSIDAIDKNTAVTISKEGAIYWTTNGGENWNEQVPPGYFGDLFRVQLIDENVAWAVGRDGIIIKTTTGGVTWIDDENPNVPNEFALYQNYPNPFNPTTKIQYSVPDKVRSGTLQQNVKLVVYDILGRKITTLINEPKTAGQYEINFNGSELPSAVYYYQLTAGSFQETKKMVLLK